MRVGYDMVALLQIKNSKRTVQELEEIIEKNKYELEIMRYELIEKICGEYNEVGAFAVNLWMGIPYAFHCEKCGQYSFIGRHQDIDYFGTGVLMEPVFGSWLTKDTVTKDGTEEREFILICEHCGEEKNIGKIPIGKLQGEE